MGNASSISRPCPEALPAVSFSQKELALISIVRYAKGKERIFGTTKEPDSLLLHHEFILLDVVNTTTGERTFWRAEYGHLSLVWFTVIGKELPPEEQDGVYQFLEPVVPRTLADLPRTQGLFYDARCNNCQFYTGRVMLFLQRCPLPWPQLTSLSDEASAPFFPWMYIMRKHDAANIQLMPDEEKSVPSTGNQEAEIPVNDLSKKEEITTEAEQPKKEEEGSATAPGM